MFVKYTNSEQPPPQARIGVTSLAGRRNPLPESIVLSFHLRLPSLLSKDAIEKKEKVNINLYYKFF